jgi:hypothetical protein
MATTSTKAEYAGLSGPLVLIVSYYVLQVSVIAAAPMEIQGAFIALLAYLIPRTITYYAPSNAHIAEPPA